MKKKLHLNGIRSANKLSTTSKKYLLNLPILIAQILEKSLILYVVALEKPLGALLTQQNVEKENNINQILIRVEIRTLIRSIA